MHLCQGHMLQNVNIDPAATQMSVCRHTWRTTFPNYSLGISWQFNMASRHLKARFMGPTWGPSGADRTQVGPMLAPGPRWAPCWPQDPGGTHVGPMNFAIGGAMVKSRVGSEFNIEHVHTHLPGLLSGKLLSCECHRIIFLGDHIGLGNMAWCHHATAITWANVCTDVCRHIASLGHN